MLRFDDIGPAKLRQMPEAPLVGFPRTKVLRRFTQGTPLFSLRDVRENLGCYRDRDLILDLKYIFESAIVAFSPDMIAGLGVYKLRGNRYVVRCLPPRSAPQVRAPPALRPQHAPCR